MNSKLTIGICFFLVLASSLCAQEDVSNALKKVKTVDESSFKSKIQLGFIAPISQGNNFVANGIDTTVGFSLNLDIAKKNLLWGLYYSRFGGDIREPSIAGPIDRIRFNHFLLKLGYLNQDKNKWYYIIPKVGVGLSSYTNSIDNVNFFDTGFTAQVGLEFLLKLSKNFTISIELDQRWDFLQIDTAAELKDDFGTVKFLIPNFGIQFLIF